MDLTKLEFNTQVFLDLGIKESRIDILENDIIPNIDQAQKIEDKHLKFLIDPPADSITGFIDERDKAEDFIEYRSLESFKAKLPRGRIIELVKQELWALLCSGSEDLSELIEKLKSGTTDFVNTLSKLLAAKLAFIDEDIILAIIVAFLLFISKVGLSVFCELFS